MEPTSNKPKSQEFIAIRIGFKRLIILDLAFLCDMVY